MEMLQDDNTYHALDNDPTTRIQEKLFKLLEEGVQMGFFIQQMAEKLFVKHPIILIYHSLPKTHKNQFPPPLRPIVADISSVHKKLSMWVDHHLQPLVSDFIQDTKHIVKLLDDMKCDETCSWLTCDMTSLYPSIPHHIIL